MIDPCFTFLVCIAYSFLLCKLATSFSKFSISILSGKNGKPLSMPCNHEIFINRDVSPTHLKTFTGNFCGIALTKIHKNYLYPYS